jgi:cytochrome o ubiquinol oxidase subunit II
MSTKLHLAAHQAGVFQGSSSNLSGEGFADMRFKAESVSKENFDTWVKNIHTSSPSLDTRQYAKISQPSTKSAPQSYILKDTDLYKTIINKHMSHGSHNCTDRCEEEEY